MKANAIVRILIWSLVLVILIGVLTSFISEELYLNNYSVSVTEPLIHATEPPVIAMPNEESLTFDPAAIQEIDINWVSGDIFIMATKVDKITVSESDVTNSQYVMVYQKKGDKLEIDFCEEAIRAGFGVSFSADISKDLYIEVPKEWVGHSIELNVASADVELHNITLLEMDVDGASGTCDFLKCDIRDLDIDTASGDVYYEGSLNTLDFDAASASFVGEFTNTPSRIDMDGMSGSLDIGLPEDCGFIVSMEGMSRRLNSDFYGTEMRNGSHVYGDGRCRIDVDGMSCDVTIRKTETFYIDPTEETVAPEEATTP